MGYFLKIKVWEQCIRDHNFIARTRNDAMGCMSSRVHFENMGHPVQYTARARSLCGVVTSLFGPSCHICRGHKYTTEYILAYYLHLSLILSSCFGWSGWRSGSFLALHLWDPGSISTWGTRVVIPYLIVQVFPTISLLGFPPTSKAVISFFVVSFTLGSRLHWRRTVIKFAF